MVLASPIPFDVVAFIVSSPPPFCAEKEEWLILLRLKCRSRGRRRRKRPETLNATPEDAGVNKKTPRRTQIDATPADLPIQICCPTFLSRRFVSLSLALFSASDTPLERDAAAATTNAAAAKPHATAATPNAAAATEKAAANVATS